MKIKLRALIIDDEEGARTLLHELLLETLFFNEIRLAFSVDSALQELSVFEPDMIFLDIKMPGKDGFGLIKELANKNKSPGIVLVTAYEQYAVKAIKNQVFDYLLKPVCRRDLKLCISRYLKKIKDSGPDEESIIKTNKVDKIHRIRINTRTGTLFVNPSNIFYCKADGNYTLICTGEKKHLCSLNLGKVHELLQSVGFVRLGRSLIINFEYITLLDRKEFQVTLERNGESATLKISKQHIKYLDKL